jgi:hypothetical protein
MRDLKGAQLSELVVTFVAFGASLCAAVLVYLVGSAKW